MKKYLFIMLIILSLIILSSCKVESPQNNTQTDAQDTGTTAQQEYAKQREDSQAILNQAVQALDETMCEQIEIEEIRFSCGQKVMRAKALEYESERLCNKLLNEMERTGCLDSVYFKKANAEQDSSYCAKITNTNLKETCEGNLR